MMFVRLGVELGGPQTDPTRVLGQVVTGIGFLGAGVILTRDGAIRGMTSASVIWLLAAVGAAVGLDRPAAAIAMSLGALGVLVGVSVLERVFVALRSGVHTLGIAGEPEDPGARQE
jgi:putative Mg2+ transporter-C (MgtC) family protein